MKTHIFLVAICLFFTTLAVNLEVPLYTVYSRAAGFGSGLTALAFAAYVGGLLPVLIFLGGISDRVGRKPILLIGLSCVLLATVLMILSPNIYTLFITRILQGVGVGLNVGTGTAYLAELMGLQHPTSAERAAAYAALTTSLGFGGGALFTTVVLLVSNSSDTLVPVSYPVVAILTLILLAALIWLPAYNNPSSIPTALVRLPYFPAGSLRIGATIGLAWAVVGLVIAVIPTQLARVNLTAWSGLVLFLVNGTGAACQPFVRKLKPYFSLQVGFILLPLGYLLLLAGAWSGILLVLLLGAMITGAACYGFTYLGGLAEIARLSQDQRARAVSGYFLCAYLGFGIPSIPFGFLAESIGNEVTLVIFGTIIILGIAGLAFTFRRQASLSKV